MRDVHYVLKCVLAFVAVCLVFGRLVAAEEVLVIGDSLTCGPFGKHLLERLGEQGASVTLVCAVSSTPSNWLRGVNPSGQKCQTMTSTAPELKPCGVAGEMPKLTELLAKHRNSLVLVGLGTNSLLAPKADASYGRMAKLIKDDGHACNWIGPPRLNPMQSRGFPSGRVAAENANVNSFYDSVSSALDPTCNLIDSRDATAPGTPGNDTVDGVHRTDKAGIYWVAQVLSRVTRPNAIDDSDLPGIAR